MWEQEEAGPPGPGRPGEGQEPAGDPAEWVEQLARVMGAWPDAPLRAWQSGRGNDPWGTSTSDAWHRWVQKVCYGAWVGVVWWQVRTREGPPAIMHGYMCCHAALPSTVLSWGRVR